ncbi:iron ABC transporter permease [Staphylococcus aureus]|uniref:Siderophore ABC transporter permease n=1 Tax=Staphylococcus aureus TaxID=1280 RepID=A0AA40JP53_STAAU|nr:iron chelate uptake ABC transporter family permease subunit [Staphylococcus aureus]KIT97842.1 siderophore ABC transporter permease [Staphylococcus aureus]URH52699.1 iron ABC transporter permease [Staphylococcus aureus]CZQ65816.1 Heme ABC type transporter HtsABC%2C permease protein HtsB [Staphylococcus aureus]CZQ67249.1 Heme ABC type transporter HtsABC%2C permease protein HtsB [Staphylococcus aureus]SCT08593.1 Heme ABC type transporter HtsABC, permease protein HtsB [Staphylococcus aureus]
MAIKEISSQSAIDHKRKRRTTLTYIVSLCFLFICIYLNMAIGSSKINFSDIVHYVTGHTDTKATFLLYNVRVPRMIAGLFIGGALAVSGLLMQAMTRNPLASPKIFGVSSGASFFIVFVTIIIPSLEYYALYLGVIGAFIGGLTVYTLSGATKGMTPIKLALAGMAIHLFFSSMTEGIIILNENSNEQVMFWLVGSLSSMKWDEILTILPWIIGALIVTIFIGRQLTIMELGDDIAKGLGQNINKVRIIIGLLVIILTGMSVSVAGPIGFVGLIVPHIVKRYVSKNYLVMIPLTFIIGADLLLLSDVLSRLITYPYESPVGIVTSFVGALYFLFITIKGVKRI